MGTDQTITWLCHLDEHVVDAYDETWKDRLSAALMNSMHALNYALLVSPLDLLAEYI